MRVGILGSGLMGSKLGTLFARAGHEVVFSYARSREKLQQLSLDAGKNARAGTPREAAQHTDALLLAVHWLLAQKPWIVPIPGTTKLVRLEENIRAAAIELTPDDLREIDSAASKITVQGARYPEKLEQLTGR